MSQSVRKVWVRRQWNDWQFALYRLDQVEDVHWSRVSGGGRIPAPQPFLHGYVMCNDMLEGELAHSGLHGPCPHRIKVCVTKKGNDRAVYAQLVEVAGPKPG